MINKVRVFLKEYNIENKSVVIAFSAGPDSCAISRLLNDLKEEFNLKITLAYFNHMWRKEALEEEKFCREFAKKINADYIIGRAPLNTPQNEEIARELRYKFLYNAADKKSSDTVFLAHNKNDNIETLIYRVIKGTSVKGLCAIPANRDIFYRPLLSVEKDEILKYLSDINQNYLIDNSNSDTKYKRNFIRQKIMPLFQEINPNFINNIDNLIKTSIASSKILEDAIQEQIAKITLNNVINRNLYLELGREYRYEILNSYLGDKLKYRDYKTIRKLDDFVVKNPHSKTSLNKYEFLRTRKGKIFIEKSKEQENE